MKRKLPVLFALVSIAVLFIGSNAFAAFDNNHNFAFRILGYHANSQEIDSYYRSTNDTQNAWKCQVTYSEEPGTNTIARFWMEKSSGVNVTPTRDIQEGAGAKYTAAYSTASDQTVWLTSENNNYNSNIFYIQGYWDEETGKLPN